MVEKVCTDCGESKPEEDFYFADSSKRWRRPWCKRCHWLREKPRRLQKRDELYEFIALAKNKPCADCHTPYPHWIMHFDHLGKEDKEANLSSMLRSWGMSKEKLQAEIDKCEVVCANCHADRTYRRSHGIPLRGVGSTAACG